MIVCVHSPLLSLCLPLIILICTFCLQTLLKNRPLLYIFRRLMALAHVSHLLLQCCVALPCCSLYTFDLCSSFFPPKIYSLICLEDKVIEGGTGIFHLLVHSPNCSISSRWTSPKPGSQNFPWFSPMAQARWQRAALETKQP